MCVCVCGGGGGGGHMVYKYFIIIMIENNCLHFVLKQHKFVFSYNDIKVVW